MIHPHTELRFINDQIGYGIVALKPIPKGTITWVLDKLDRKFTPQDVRSMDLLYQQVLDKYTYRNAEGNHILCWDNARFVNHSSRSNCLTTAYEFEVAIRDIAVGEELTDDYGYLNLEEPFEVIPEPGSERDVIYPDDLLRYYPEWDEELLQTFPMIMRVPQPLFQLLDQALQRKVEDIAAGRKQMDSILKCYFQDVQTKPLNGFVHKNLERRSPRVAYP
ncbi:MAG: SET domain-containing protein [Bacteroidota bacterium]|nr:SET domain-containing protein [Bacteroidota bacterium]